MIAVIFEVTPAEGLNEDYLSIAGNLRPSLEGVDGFVSIERFQSLSDPGRLLSLSVWRDETAVRAWRNNFSHRGAQKKGRERIFSDYRVRVCRVLRDYGPRQREEAPEDS